MLEGVSSAQKQHRHRSSEALQFLQKKTNTCVCIDQTRAKRLAHNTDAKIIVALCNKHMGGTI